MLLYTSYGFSSCSDHVLDRLLGESEEMEGVGGKGRGGRGRSSHSTTPAVRTLVKQRGGFNESLAIDGSTIGQHLASSTKVSYRLGQGGAHPAGGNPT